MDLILLKPGDDGLFPPMDGPALPGDTPAAWVSKLEPAKCIQLVSVQQGMKQQITTDVSNTARTSGRPLLTDFTCTKYVDRASVKLYEYCLRAAPLGAGADRPTYVHILRGAGQPSAQLITYALRDALITEIGLQSHPDDAPTEVFKLNFTEILWSFTTQGTGRDAGNVSAGWSVLRNRPIGQFT